MIFVDSDIIIDFLKGKSEAIKKLKDIDNISTTEINIYEIYYGIYDKENVSQKEIEATDTFFQAINLTNPSFGKAAARIFTGLKKGGREIQESDCMIAAIILASGNNKIITRNKNHFSRIQEIEAIGY